MDIKFGTDGWRGMIARDFTFSNVRRVAHAIADFLKSSPQIPGPGGKPLPLTPRTKVVIGYDHRFQSEHFAEVAARVLQASGIQVILSAEPLPAPAVSYLTAKTDLKLGVVVTASHNPPSYNGMKMKITGRAVPEAVTSGVEAALGKMPSASQKRSVGEDAVSEARRSGGGPAGDGEVARKSFRRSYLGFLRSLYNTGAIARKLTKPVVIDYMYGAACGLMEEVLPYRRLVSIHNHRDPLFGGIQPEPIEPYVGALRKAVAENKAVVGIALDGDADRVGIVDEKGRYLTPCQVFPLIMEYLLEKRKLKGKVVQSLSLGYLSKRVAAAHGLPFEEVPVGFKFIAEKMLAEDVAFGGEESGGYSWKGLLPERDGMVSALLFLEMLAQTKKTPGQLYEALSKKYGRSFFVRRDIRLAKPVDKKHFLDRLVKGLPAKPAGLKIVGKSLIDGAKIFFDNDEWLLMRPSGTEPLIRTYAETDGLKKTEALLDAAEKTIRQVLS
jgi:phosphomannomutase